MNKGVLLFTGITFFTVQNINATNIDMDTDIVNKAGTVAEGKVFHSFDLEGSIFSKYCPQEVKCGTFHDLLKEPRIQIGERSYEFIGGSEIYNGNQVTLKTQAQEVLPSTNLGRALSMSDAYVDVNGKSLFLSFTYPDAYWPKYSYSITVKTDLDDTDREEAQIQIILNQYIPDQATRDAFQNLKSYQFCMLNGHNKFFAFVDGSKIYSDHVTRMSSPSDVLPSNLWANGWRPNHQLVHAGLDLHENAVLLTYQYVPSIWYTGKATRFSFTVKTPLLGKDAESLKLLKTEQMAQNLYSNILSAHQHEFITHEEFADFFLGTNSARLNCKQALLNDEMNMKTVEGHFSFWKSKLAMATSPLSLMFAGKFDGNIFALQRSQPQLSVVTDSIQAFKSEGQL